MGMNPAAGHNERELAARRELFAVLAHEFRSPIGAVLGFEELLTEGIFGEVSDSGREALARIRSSARQLLDLVAGLSDLSGSRGADEPPAQHAVTDVAALLAAVVEDVRHDALGRDTDVQLAGDPDLVYIETDPEALQRAARLALMAAIKSTAGGTITLRPSTSGQEVRLDVEGSQLELPRDEPDLSLQDLGGPRLTGAGLRIAMARNALAPLRGQVAMLPGNGVILRIVIPRSPGAARD